MGISTAIKTALKVALYDFFDGPPAPLNSQLMDKVNHYNWTKQIDFGWLNICMQWQKQLSPMYNLIFSLQLDTEIPLKV